METVRKLFFLYVLIQAALLGDVKAQGLSGTRTIGGASPDFPTLRAAIDTLNARGVGAGGITFIIRNGVYNETDSLSIVNLNSSAANPVVFRADAGSTIVINFLIRNRHWGIRIQNSDYITFDGSSGGTDTGKRITLNGNRINETDEYFTTYISNGSDFCTFKNLIITHQNNAANTGFSLPVYWSTFQVALPDAGMNGLSLMNCRIVGGGTYGVFLDGDPVTKKIRNASIAGNQILDFARFGVILNADVDSVSILGNQIFQTRRGRSAVYGINVESSTCSNTLIRNNDIRNLQPDSLAGAFGIFLGTGSQQNTLINNVIYLTPQPTANTSYGIYALTSGGNRVFHNSVYMGGVSTRTVSSYAFRSTADTGNDSLVNNIFVNARSGSTSPHFAMRVDTSLTLVRSDNNFLSVLSDSAGDNRFVAQVGARLCNTLTDLQLVPGYAPRDGASRTGDPLWNQPLLTLQAGSPCINAAQPIAFIPNDRFGNPRVGVPDIGAYEFQGSSSAQNEGRGGIRAFKLEQNYPNPFNPSTAIRYQVSGSSDVRLEVFDMLGRKVSTLVSERQSAGTYQINFNAATLSSGIYFYRLTNGTATDVKKMMLAK
jgi:hypothetical protein